MRPSQTQAADDNLNLAIKGFQDTDCIENIVEKGEIGHYEQFHIFPLYSIGFFLKCVKLFPQQNFGPNQIERICRRQIKCNKNDKFLSLIK